VLPTLRVVHVGLAETSGARQTRPERPLLNVAARPLEVLDHIIERLWEIELGEATTATPSVAALWLSWVVVGRRSLDLALGFGGPLFSRLESLSEPLVAIWVETGWWQTAALRHHLELLLLGASRWREL